MINVGASCIEKFFHLRWYEHVRYEKKNDHYVCHNPATVTNPTGCSTTTLEIASSTTKGAQELCKSTDGSILTRVDCV